MTDGSRLVKRMGWLTMLLAATVAAGPVAAQSATAPDDELELTMTLLPESATEPDAVTKNIELPAPASDQGVAKSADGTANANQAHEGRDSGLANAAEAQERGRDIGQTIAAEAHDNREDQGRGNAPEPPSPPDHPVPPNPPGPPGP